MRRSLRLRLRLAPRVALRLVGMFVAALVAVSGCASAGASTPDGSAAGPRGDRIAVLGTENFYGDLLAQVGGSRVSATSLLNNPNTDPHSYEANPQAALAVANAKVVIVNGLGYDDFMQHLLAASPNPARIVIDVQQLLGLKDTANAHVWYDPATMTAVAGAAADALLKLDPAGATVYASGLDAYLASLGQLRSKIADLRAKYAGVPVAFTEPVAGDLAYAIGLKVLTPAGFQRAIENATDPGIADVAAERDLLTRRKVHALIYNSQAVTPLTQQLRDLATKNGIPVVGVAETMPPAYGSYQAWQLAQIDELERALAKGG